MLAMYIEPMEEKLSKKRSISDIFSTLVDDMFGGIYDDYHLAPKDDGAFVTTTTNLKIDSASYRSYTTESGLKLIVDVPGIDPQTIELETNANIVRITGKVGERTSTRKLTISSNYDCSTARATYEHGQVTVLIDRISLPQETWTKKPVTIKK